MIIKFASAIVAAAIMAVAPVAQASYTKLDQTTGQKLVCAESKWTLRHTDGSKSDKSLSRGECIVLIGATKDNNYLIVRGVSGSRWLLNSTPREIAYLFEDGCCEDVARYD